MKVGIPKITLGLRLQADFVVYGAPEPLLAAEVSPGRLHRHVPQQELDLLKFPAGRVA